MYSDLMELFSTNCVLMHIYRGRYFLPLIHPVNCASALFCFRYCVLCEMGMSAEQSWNCEKVFHGVIVCMCWIESNTKHIQLTAKFEYYCPQLTVCKHCCYIYIYFDVIIVFIMRSSAAEANLSFFLFWYRPNSELFWPESGMRWFGSFRKILWIWNYASI